MNYFENWYLEHKNYSIRSYADRILNIELPTAFEKNDVVVLAACPNSGKTIMSIAWIDKYIFDNPTHRILVLTHGQTLLRNQFTNEINDANVGFTYKEVVSSNEILLSNEQVVITLPQTINRQIDDIDSDFDVLIVDEAHQFYFAEMIQSIIKHFKFKKQLLLTGTPAPFIARKMDIIAVALEELFEGGYASDPIVVISKTNYDIKKTDFNKDNELKVGVILSIEKTNDTLNSLLTIIESKVLKTGWKQIFESLGKTMFFCKNVSQAEDVHRYLKIAGVKSLLSTSYNDKSSTNIAKFSDINSDVNVLIVVDRGILGFNLPTLVNVIDMKCGKNISNLFQLFNRITRIHPKGNQKYFFKIVPEQFEEEFTYLLSASISLMIKSNYIKYNGSNDEDVVVPVKKKSVKCEGDGKRKNRSKWNFEPIRYIDVPVSKMWIHSNIVWNTLASIKKNLMIDNSEKIIYTVYTEEENYQHCLGIIKNVIKERKKWYKTSEYKWIRRNNLLDRMYKELNMKNPNRKINCISNHSLIRCVELYKRNNVKNIHNEMPKEYDWLLRNKLVKEFNALTVGGQKQQQNHSLDRCVEVYKKNSVKIMYKEMYKEYAWLRRNNLMNEFQLKIKS